MFEDETHTISGVQVEFPFTPYPCQLAYMEKVLQSLQKVDLIHVMI